MGIIKIMWNNRFLVLLLTVIFMPLNAAFAGKIGVMMTGDIPYYQHIHQAFVDSISKEGHEIVLQKPVPDPMSWTNTARKLTTIGSQVIVTYGVPATLTTMKVTSDIPIVFAGVYDPESMGLTGKNATGISSTVSVEMVLKKMNEISKLSNVAVILSKAEKDSILQAKIIKSSESSLGFTSTLISVTDKVEKSQISGVNAILVTTCSTGMMNIKDIIESGRNSRILTAAMIGGGENDGVILTVAANPEEQGKELAGMVSKVLGGASPSQIPFKNPTKVEIILNLKEAAAIGIDIPANIKSSATKVIE